MGFYYKGTSERRYKEAFIFIPRKNGKTTFIAALAWGLALLERRSGATLYIVAASQKQAIQSFEFILNSLRASGMIEDFRVRDNNAEHSISYQFTAADGRRLAASILRRWRPIPMRRIRSTAILPWQMKSMRSRRLLSTIALRRR